jgi:hypothetical protein
MSELSKPRDAFDHLRIKLGGEGAASVLAACLTAAATLHAIEHERDHDCLNEVADLAFTLLAQTDLELR